MANDYRITGPVASLTDIIDQVCQDAGCDYFVELLPVENELVIKVFVEVVIDEFKEINSGFKDLIYLIAFLLSSFKSL